MGRPRTRPLDQDIKTYNRIKQKEWRLQHPERNKLNLKKSQEIKKLKKIVSGYYRDRTIICSQCGKKEKIPYNTWRKKRFCLMCRDSRRIEQRKAYYQKIASTPEGRAKYNARYREVARKRRERAKQNEI